MAETMIEKMAKTMRERYAEHSGDHDIVPWEKSKSREAWLLCARAALLAIREPDGLPFTNEVVDTEGGWETPRKVWKDTIDAILSGEA